MSLPLDFLSAAGHEITAHPTPDSRALGSRPVYKNEVPTPPVPSRDDLIPVSPSSPPLEPSPMSPSPHPPIPQLQREYTRRRLLPPAMTDSQLSECSKLFWQSGDNVWYQPDNAYQIFDYKASPTYHCHDFASRITHLELPLHLVDYHVMAITGREFWDRVQELFPSARNVVLSSSSELRGRQHFIIRDPSLFTSELVELAPPNITPFVAMRPPREDNEDEEGLRYRLWQVKAHSWNLIQDTWTPMRVMLPPKKVPCGLLNDFLRSDWLIGIALCEMRAISWLKLETYARYSDRRGFECPDPECKSLKFYNLKEFKKHILKECRGSPLFTRDLDSVLGRTTPEDFKGVLDRDLVVCHRNTPVERKAIIDTKQRRVDKLVSIRNALKDGLRDQYRRPGEAKLQFEEALTAQMKEHGYLTPDEQIWDAYLWTDCDEDLFEFDDSQYPDAKDIDPECPEEECLDRDYAGEEYFEYPN
ncbi:hypothetical protein PENSUB_1040 [Penicillium subrubescens]|uniref:Uncharacterized protein n=1 Tax=Penicillium subrubescens TaxID=1316194 RepID=A0A1Q5ULH9_9EURO|nr:hypothetical protein PENSUB_1040 [Penicillium subrubescens]